MAKFHDYDKILTRLTLILQRLYEGERLSVSTLAKEFNVSTKTIQRDFNERLVRFPIEKSGHLWKMQAGFSLTKERTPKEMLVIEMLENIAQSIGAEFGSQAKELFGKLQNKTSSAIYSKTIIEDISDKLELFRMLEDAMEHKKIVSFDYKETKRVVAPYKIVSFDGYWYLYGEDVKECKLKTFYFKDILDLKIENESFEPKSEYKKRLEMAINVWFEPDKEPFLVKLNVSADIAKYFHRRPLSATQRILKSYEDGSMDISVLATSMREVLHEVKKWMPDLIVLEPHTLAKQAQKIAENFLDKYPILVTFEID